MKAFCRFILTLGILAGVVFAQAPSRPAPVAEVIPYSAAKSVVEALRDDLLPPELRALTPAAREATWPGWAARHDAEIRARLERGEEDSIINFLLFGTTFTSLPRAAERDLALVTSAQPDALPPGIRRRTDALIAGISAPSGNERLQFVLQFIEHKGMTPLTAAGKADIRRYLTGIVFRVSAEIVSLSARRLNDPSIDLVERLTRFRDRGLSSDTSIFADYGIEQTLAAVKAGGLLPAVRRVAIIGPGLDFTDKHEGYDFYPEQTSQPFAVIDSLIRLGMANASQLQLTTFDLSTRINHHLATVRERADRKDAYVLQLPRAMDMPWTPGLSDYWKRFGDSIGDETAPAAVPPTAGKVQMRAVRVRPGVMASITARDLNIVLQRIEPLAEGERFDLIVATNVLTYYDAFEQSLALLNIATMLKPGGMLLTNNGVFELPETPMAWIGSTDVTYMRLPDVGDTVDLVFWYQRQ